MQYICDILHIIHLELPVNLTSSTSVVQIHLFPPQRNNTNVEKRSYYSFFVFCLQYRTDPVKERFHARISFRQTDLSRLAHNHMNSNIDTKIILHK